jgi:hypothetical protein
MDTFWSPFTIPPCLPPDGKKYALSFSDEADPEANPSAFLEWKELLPKGTTKGDILYWDPAEGESGEWVVLSAPSGTGLKVLTANGGNLAWNDTEDC